MHHLIEQLKAAGACAFGMLAAVTIDGSAMIPLGAAAGVILVIVRLTAKWQVMEDKVESMSAELRKINKLLMTRPCFKNQPCEVSKCDEK